MWFPLSAPDGTEVYPIRNDGKEGRWRLGQNNPLITKIKSDCEYAHWEMRPYDNGVDIDGKTERWVPYEKIRDTKKVFGWDTWLDSHGFNADATRELKEIFGSKPFNTPKPTQLLKWIISLYDDDNALILDSFAGSGSTAHATLQLNAEDGGNRHFIVVEMDSKILSTVTIPRVNKVITGYGNQKGTGGGFTYCELGTLLFNPEGQIGDSVTFKDLAHHVFFIATGEPLPHGAELKTPLLGVANGAAVYLLYNGILGDKSVNGGNVLTREVLASLPPHDGTRIIYGNGCRIGPERLRRENIIFRQIPYEVRVS